MKKYIVRSSKFCNTLNISLGEDAADVVGALADWMNNHRVSDAELRKFLNNGQALPEDLSEGILILVEIVKNLLNLMAQDDTDSLLMLDQTILCFLFLRNYAITRLPGSVGPRYVDLTNEFCQTCTYLVGAKLQYNDAEAGKLLLTARAQIKDILQLLR
jgi:hypothetical protein